MPAGAVGIANPRMMSLVGASVAPATWNGHGPVVPQVWFLGHSYIFWAVQRADCRPGGYNLGFCNVVTSWRGCRGLWWSQVLPEAIEISRISCRRE